MSDRTKLAMGAVALGAFGYLAVTGARAGGGNGGNGGNGDGPNGDDPNGGNGDDPEPEPTLSDGLFLTADEWQSKIAAWESGSEPVASAADKAIDTANWRIDTPLQSVQSTGVPPHPDRSSCPNDASKFDGSGSNNPAGNNDYEMARDMCYMIRDCAIAHRLTGEDRFAQKSIEAMEFWCADPDTRMCPSARNHGEDYFSPELHVTQPAIPWAAQLLAGHSAWTDETGVRNWCQQYRDSLMVDLDGIRGPDQDFGSFFYAAGMFARYLGDDSAMSLSVDLFEDALDFQINSDGFLHGEAQRADGLFYHSFTLRNYLVFAYLAELEGYNVADHQTPNGGLQRVLNTFERYVNNPDRWVNETPYQEADGFQSNEQHAGPGAYEVAGKLYDPGYYAVSEPHRPLGSPRMHSHPTLLFA